MGRLWLIWFRGCGRCRNMYISCICVCRCMCIYIRGCSHEYRHRCIFVSTYTNTCIRARIQVSESELWFLYTGINMYVVHVCTCEYVYRRDGTRTLSRGARCTKDSWKRPISTAVHGSTNASRDTHALSRTHTRTYTCAQTHEKGIYWNTRDVQNMRMIFLFLIQHATKASILMPFFSALFWSTYYYLWSVHWCCGDSELHDVRDTYRYQWVLVFRVHVQNTWSHGYVCAACATSPYTLTCLSHLLLSLLLYTIYSCMHDIYLYNACMCIHTHVCVCVY